MLKIRLRPDLLPTYSNTSMQGLAHDSGLSYPTVFAMAKGKWNPTCFDLLAKYLDTLGFDAEELKETKLSEIFKIEETSDGQEKLH